MALNPISDLFKDNDKRTAVIVGSGPSLEGFNFEGLASKSVFTFSINEEAFRNRDAYEADAWIFFDGCVMKRHEVDKLPEKTIVMCSKRSKQRIEEAVFQPKWIDSNEIYVFGQTKKWHINSDRMFMDRTTAAAALCIAVRMGFKRILLAGVDCFSKLDSYYYTGQPPAQTRENARKYFAEGKFMESRHIRMVANFRQINEALRNAEWPGQVIQLSLDSPMDMFPRMTFAKAMEN